MIQVEQFTNLPLSINCYMLASAQCIVFTSISAIILNKVFLSFLSLNIAVLKRIFRVHFFVVVASPYCTISFVQFFFTCIIRAISCIGFNDVWYTAIHSQQWLHNLPYFTCSIYIAGCGPIKRKK